MIISIIKYLRFYGGPYRCNVCRRPIRKFFPFSESLERKAKEAGFGYSFKRMETLNYENCNCPFCLSSDRERLYLLFLEFYFSKHPGTYSVLDFAPSLPFARVIKKFKFVKYTSADYLRDDYDLKLDICDMSNIPSNSYNVVICSHVLEHVSNPDKAIAEVHRVLDLCGIAIMMVPLFYGVEHTLENQNCITPELRCKYYGQEDHVRLFNRNDFIKRLSNAPFNVKEINTSSFDPDTIRRLAISDNSILYVVSKAD